LGVFESTGDWNFAMTKSRNIRNILPRLLPVLLGVATLVLLVLYLGGAFRSGQIGPEDATRPGEPFLSDQQIREAREVILPQWHAAVGTVRARTAIHIEAQITARVDTVHVRPGEQVDSGHLLLELDRRALEARRQQARQALSAATHQQSGAARQIDAATARLTQTAAQYERIRGFVQVEAATRQQLEEAEAAWRQAVAGRDQAVEGLRQADAGVELARRQLEEAEVSLGYSRITAPLRGQVVDRLVEPGDLATPGKPLLTLHSDMALRLEALVPESLVARVRPGQEVRLEIAASGHTGVVEEMVPAADPQARSFVVKVTLSDVPGIYPGMFGRLLVPLDARPAVLVPKRAVIRVGQLELVQLVRDDRITNVLVTTGETFDDDIEILSGLSGGERVIIHGAPNE
jgi:HlyD family secretion protein